MDSGTRATEPAEAHRSLAATGDAASNSIVKNDGSTFIIRSLLKARLPMDARIRRSHSQAWRNKCTPAALYASMHSVSKQTHASFSQLELLSPK